MESEASLLEVLARAQAQGFLGPGDPAAHLAHAQGFAEAALSQLGGPPAAFADLGTGGGVPGSRAGPVLARGPGDRSSSRPPAAVQSLAGVDSPARPRRPGRVVEGRAERLGHDPALREHFDLVTARSFARPAVTAEVAVAFVRTGGLVVVSEPPEPAPERWPDAALDELGFGPMVAVEARGRPLRLLAEDPQGRPDDAPPGRKGRKEAALVTMFHVERRLIREFALLPENVP